MFGRNPNVEAATAELMEDGNFFFNSWEGKRVPQPGYQPASVILSGSTSDPRTIIPEASLSGCKG